MKIENKLFKMMIGFYDNNFEIADVDIQRNDDGFGLLVNEATTQNDIDEYLVLAEKSKHSSESPLNINVQFETVNSRKAKQILEILNLLLEHFDIECLLILWYYEATDEKAYELGLRTQILTGINFSFQVY